jgi:hypothetical protein
VSASVPRPSSERRSGCSGCGPLSGSSAPEAAISPLAGHLWVTGNVPCRNRKARAKPSRAVTWRAYRPLRNHPGRRRTAPGPGDRGRGRDAGPWEGGPRL